MINQEELKRKYCIAIDKYFEKTKGWPLSYDQIFDICAKETMKIFKTEQGILNKIYRIIK